MPHLFPAIQPKKQNQAILLISLALGISTIGLDFFFARVEQTGFYLSESSLFSTYWLLFVPFLNVQWYLVRWCRRRFPPAILAFGTSLGHLLVYPLLVSVLSFFFLDHTYSYLPTLSFAITSYSIQGLLVYLFAGLLMNPATHNKVIQDSPPEACSDTEVPRPETTPFPTTFIVSTQHKKEIVAVGDILYFEANPPYINIHHRSGKYLHAGTLKSLESKLDPARFVRTHKSCIVQIGEVVSYKSRLNGDYDLNLTNGQVLRLSRTFAAKFRTALEQAPRVTTK